MRADEWPQDVSFQSGARNDGRGTGAKRRGAHGARRGWIGRPNPCDDREVKRRRDEGRYRRSCRERGPELAHGAIVRAREVALTVMTVLVDEEPEMPHEREGDKQPPQRRPAPAETEGLEKAVFREWDHASLAPCQGSKWMDITFLA